MEKFSEKVLKTDKCLIYLWHMPEICLRYALDRECKFEKIAKKSVTEGSSEKVSPRKVIASKN